MCFIYHIIFLVTTTIFAKKLTFKYISSISSLPYGSLSRCESDCNPRSPPHQSISLPNSVPLLNQVTRCSACFQIHVADTILIFAAHRGLLLLWRNRTELIIRSAKVDWERPSTFGIMVIDIRGVKANGWRNKFVYALRGSIRNGRGEREFLLSSLIWFILLVGEEVDVVE